MSELIGRTTTTSGTTPRGRRATTSAALFDATRRDSPTDVVAAIVHSADTDTDTQTETDTDDGALVIARRTLPTRALMAARLAGVGAAACVLCGSLAAAAIISERRAASNATVTTQPVLEITGVAALDPEVLAANSTNDTGRAAGSAAAGTDSAAAPAPGVAPSESAVGPPTAPEPDAPAPPAQVGPDAVSPLPAPVVPDPRIGVVERFYGLIVSRPVDAFRLLSGDLGALGLTEFLNSWGRVTAIDVLDVRALPGREVVATVRMLLSDGSVLRVRQLLTVADQGRIVGARLLSTQRG